MSCNVRSVVTENASFIPESNHKVASVSAFGLGMGLRNFLRAQGPRQGGWEYQEARSIDVSSRGYIIVNRIVGKRTSRGT
eukprot:2933178-Pyramimonas_sp.AAC.1